MTNKDSIAARERRTAQAQRFNLLSNVFMSVALQEPAACQYVLRTLTGIADLTVRQVRTQYRISKLVSHDAVLDILAQDGAGRMYNVEIQRADTVDHARRLRFYGAMIDSEYLEKGADYAQMPEVYLIYISETDLWREGRASYWLDKGLRGSKAPYDDGQHTLYVNAAAQDGSAAAALMQYFKTADPEDRRYGALSERVHYLKCEEGGKREMCEISEQIFMEGKVEGRAEGRMEGKAEGREEGREEGILCILHGLIQNANMTVDEALRLAGLSEQERERLAGKL